MQLLFDLQDILYFPRLSLFEASVRPRSGDSAKRVKQLIEFYNVGVIGTVDLKPRRSLKRTRTARQFMCIESENVENAILVGTLYSVSSGAEKVRRLRPKKQGSRSQNVTLKKTRGKPTKTDGQMKIVLQQFVK